MKDTEKNIFTITVYAENTVGILNRISNTFLKRHINIESLVVSESEIEYVARFVIVVKTSEDWAFSMVKQIEKQVDVIKAYYHRDEEIIALETALYKIKANIYFDQQVVQNIIRENHAQIVTAARDYIVISKTGLPHEIKDLYAHLQPYGIMQFVQSGRIAVSKSAMLVTPLLQELTEEQDEQ